MRVDRTWGQYLDPRFSAIQIAEAISDGRRFTCQRIPTPAGTLYRVLGYTRSDAAARPVLEDDEAGMRTLALLVVEFVDEGDRGEVALVTYVLEADEEDFAAYG